MYVMTLLADHTLTLAGLDVALLASETETRSVFPQGVTSLLWLVALLILTKVLHSMPMIAKAPSSSLPAKIIKMASLSLVASEQSALIAATCNVGRNTDLYSDKLHKASITVQAQSRKLTLVIYPISSYSPKASTLSHSGDPRSSCK